MTTSLSSPPFHSAENWEWEGPVSPGSSLVLREGGIPAAREPLLPRPCRQARQAPQPKPGKHCAPGLSSARAARGARALQRSRLRPESGRAAPAAPGSLPGGRAAGPGTWAAVRAGLGAGGALAAAGRVAGRRAKPGRAIQGADPVTRRPRPFSLIWLQIPVPGFAYFGIQWKRKDERNPQPLKEPHRL